MSDTSFHDNALSPTHPGSLVWILGVLAIMLLLFFIRAAPLGLDPPRTENSPGQFDTGRAVERLGRVLDGTPHPVDSTALDETRTRLLREITALGYTPEVRVHNVCDAMWWGVIHCALVQNIYFRAGPAEGSALLLTAHYDSVPASPGFADDGIGIAVWMEVAHLLKQETLRKPVVFLFTDGEETGLLGAQAFVDDFESYGFRVGRVINLEARGVRGPAVMFETSRPNAALVSDWSQSGARPFANSMMTAVYERLPNATDLTVFLHAGFNGINIAIADGVELYHTTRDDLAALDRASVQHMGDQALGAARAFLEANWSNDAAAGEIVFSDIASRVFVKLPQLPALILLGLCFGISALLLARPARVRSWGRLDWRVLALPPALIVGAGLAAFALQEGIGFLRPEPVYWTAHPQALNTTIFAATLLVATILLAWLTPKAPVESIHASGWFWFLMLGMGISFALPGFTMIVLIPGIAFVIASAAAWHFPRWQLVAYAVASLVLALIFFPLIHLLDVTMGLGMAAMFGVVEAMVLAPMLALVGPVAQHRRPILLALGGVVVSAGIVTLIVPAYSVDRPLALNFTAHYDIDERTAVLFAGAHSSALPAGIRDQLVVDEFTSPSGIAPNRAAKELKFAERPFAEATVLGVDDTDGTERIVSLRLSAPGARVIRLRIPAEARPIRIGYGDHVYRAYATGSSDYVIDITGRAADGAVVDVVLKNSAGTTEWLVQGIWAGLPVDALDLAALRPDTTVRHDMGDVTITSKVVPLQASAGSVPAGAHLHSHRQP